MKPDSKLVQTEPAVYGRSQRRFDHHFVVFEVEDTLYRELRYGFEKWSDSEFPSMFGIEEEIPSIEGGVGSAENPLQLSGCTAAEFESLLEALYPVNARTAVLSKDQWIDVLKLTRLWNMPRMATIAINTIGSDLSPVEKIALGKASAHQVPGWVEEGYAAVIGDLNKVTLDALATFGWEASARVLWAFKEVASQIHPSLTNLKAKDLVNQIIGQEFKPAKGPENPSRPPIIVTQDQPVPHRAGKASVICFATDGVYVSKDCVQPPTLAIRDFGHDAGGWRVENHVRLVGDTTGSGRSDIIGFGHSGVLVSRNNADGTFSPIELVLNNLGYGAGSWRVEKHLRYAVDLRKKGCVDLIGFGDAGVFVALNNGNGTGTFSAAKFVLSDFGYNAGGWRLDRHLRFLADVTGNGLPDIVGFGETHVFVALNNGDGTFQDGKVAISHFTPASGGWSIEKHPRTLADLTGDGRADIVGFFEDGVYVALNAGDGTFHPPKLVVKEFGYSQAWKREKYPRFVADVTGDGRGDIVGSAYSHVYVALNNGDGTFKAPVPVFHGFGEEVGWHGRRHLRFLADLTGNGTMDIIGFKEDEVWRVYGDGKGGFGSPEKLTGYFASSAGTWSTDKTVRYVTNMYP